MVFNCVELVEDKNMIRFDICNEKVGFYVSLCKWIEMGRGCSILFIDFFLYGMCDKKLFGNVVSEKIREHDNSPT